jgi:hypothetical protein
MGEGREPDTDRSSAGQEPDDVLGDELAIEPFETIITETRTAIIRALATHHAQQPRNPWLGFADLRERAGIEDSGNFNYHLSRLQPAYVKQTDDGYRLTNAGLSLVGILQAGVGIETTRGPEQLDSMCPLCGTVLTASYEDGILSVSCENDHGFPQDFLPPNAVSGRPLREVISIQTRRTLHHLELVRSGVCPACFDDVEREHTTLDVPQASHVLTATCESCGWASGSPFGLYLLREPPVVAFYYDHGIDVTEAFFWELALPVVEPQVEANDPLRLSLSVERDGERLTLIVDEYTRLLDSDRAHLDR